jgi:hypothetical protein
MLNYRNLEQLKTPIMELNMLNIGASEEEKGENSRKLTSALAPDPGESGSPAGLESPHI